MAINKMDGDTQTSVNEVREEKNSDLAKNIVARITKQAKANTEINDSKINVLKDREKVVASFF